MMNRKQRGRLYNVVRPFENCGSVREAGNMFCGTVYGEEKREGEDLDRFVAGAKMVRIYKNSIKRKKKLTLGITDNTYRKWT